VGAAHTRKLFEKSLIKNFIRIAQARFGWKLKSCI